MSDTFGLALGGGGARGAAHIGVLLELERIGKQPSIISGTSIGSMVGGLYAAGVDLDGICDFISDLNLNKVFAIPRSTISVTANKRLAKLLEKRMGRPRFDQLNVPFYVVATDLLTRNAHVMNTGDVITAILASSAIPGVFPVVERDGKILVDGGITNNTPIDVLRTAGATTILAVDLSNTGTYGTEPDKVEYGTVVDRSVAALGRQPLVEVLLHVFDTMMSQSLQMQLLSGEPDILLRPYFGSIGALDFYRLQDGIEAGRTAFFEQRSAIQQKLSPQ